MHDVLIYRKIRTSTEKWLDIMDFLNRYSLGNEITAVQESLQYTTTIFFIWPFYVNLTFDGVFSWLVACLFYIDWVLLTVWQLYRRFSLAQLALYTS